MTAEESKESKGPSTTLFGVLSAVYLVVVLVGAASLGYFDKDGNPIEPNEWGDVLAGVFSPLAFLWLIYASLSQRAELAMQRAELTANNVTQDAQREEMRKQVEAMTAQAKLLEAQASAALDPIFVIENARGVNGQIYVDLVNHGCDIVDALFSENIEVKYKDGNTVGFDNEESRVYVWHSHKRVTISPRQGIPSADFSFGVKFTRKDGRIKSFEFQADARKPSLRRVLDGGRAAK